MLEEKINDFLTYCKVSNFSKKSIETFTIRLREFNSFVDNVPVGNIKSISYKHLLAFVAEYKNPSIHIKKSRVWSLHQFFHFLKIHKCVTTNIALDLPYPKIEQTVCQFLTIDELNRILGFYAQKADSRTGLRNLIIIMLLGFCGLRSGAIISMDVNDVDIISGIIAVREKGYSRKRIIVIPEIICILIYKYLELLKQKQGPLFLSERNKRISSGTLQNVFRQAADSLEIDKHLHAHLFRHTAGTQLNKVAGIDITRHVLGHSQRQNTEKYTHLNPDQYAVYMKQHPFMKYGE